MISRNINAKIFRTHFRRVSFSHLGDVSATLRERERKKKQASMERVKIARTVTAVHVRSSCCTLRQRPGGLRKGCLFAF